MSAESVLVVGLASVYLWFLLDKAGITEPLFRRFRQNEGWIGYLLRCPWCSGFWITGLILLVTGHYDPLTHLAASTVAGVVGDYIS